MKRQASLMITFLLIPHLVLPSSCPSKIKVVRDAALLALIAPPVAGAVALRDVSAQKNYLTNLLPSVSPRLINSTTAFGLLCVAGRGVQAALGTSYSQSMAVVTISSLYISGSYALYLLTGSKSKSK